jgi:hypothetical protein
LQIGNLLWDYEYSDNIQSIFITEPAHTIRQLHHPIVSVGHSHPFVVADLKLRYKLNFIYYFYATILRVIREKERALNEV